MKAKKIIFYLLGGVSIGILVFLLVIFFTWMEDKKNTKFLSEELRKTVFVKEEKNFISHESFINPPDDKEDIYWKYIATDYLRVDFDTLIEKNKDTVAWIQVAGTSVDYPVVQSSDNQYYLTHSFDLSSSQVGWIYADYHNNFEVFDQNTIIYGYMGLDETMFGSLKKVLEEEWIADEMNHIVKLSTPKENIIWQIFSTYTVQKENYNMVSSFSDEKSYQEFLNMITKKSTFSFPTSVSIDDKVLTLSTNFNYSEKQLIVHAKMIKKETISS